MGRSRTGRQRLQLRELEREFLRKNGIAGLIGMGGVVLSIGTALVLPSTIPFPIEALILMTIFVLAFHVLVQDSQLGRRTTQRRSRSITTADEETSAQGSRDVDQESPGAT